MNRITVLSVDALKRLAAGATMNYSGSELFQHEIAINSSTTLHLIYSSDDRAGERLIFLCNPTGGGLLPPALEAHRPAALQRVLSCAQRVQTLPFALPHAWHQYKHDNLLAFFALPINEEGSPRWITEVRPNGSNDIVFWSVTTSSDRQQLEEYVKQADVHSVGGEAWRDHLLESLRALRGPALPKSVGVDVVLDVNPTVQSIAKSWPYSEWLRNLTAPQREFVEAPSSRSIRLRGPAGSGKTLTMALKAVREAQLAREEGAPLSILFVTHSWSLAGEVDALIDALSEYGPLDEISVLPLVAVAQDILPTGMIAEGLELIGEDSLTGKALQLAQIQEVISEFRSGDWITYSRLASDGFRARMDSLSPDDERGLAWDCLIEFGCVLGADGIFPAFNAEHRYLKLPRAPWMMQLETDGDKRAVYALYESFWYALQARNLITSDQLLNDFLNYLETFAWNHRRRTEGYDLIFTDEFHLFNVQERQTLRYLSRGVSSYPRIFMALDPRQSPWEVFVGPDATGIPDSMARDEDLDDVRTVDIPTVHRLSPQILELVKHIHLDFPNLDLGSDWDFSISDVESMASPGPTPALFLSETQSDEEIAIYNALVEMYPQGHSGAQLALAIVDEDRFSGYRELMERMAQSGKFKIVSLTSREDVGLLKTHRRGIVVGPAEYLAGLQFDSVVVAGLPDMSGNAANQSYRRRRFLSLLYLAVTRASREVRVFASNDAGGIPEVLSRANEQGLLGVFRR